MKKKKRVEISMSKSKKIDLIILIIYPLFASFVSIALQVNLLFSGILFFGVPGLYLSFKVKDKILKSLGFASIFAVFLAIVPAYMGYMDQSWYDNSTIFPFRIFNTVPLEDLIWIFMIVYELILLYEYFYNPKTKIRFKSKRFNILLFGSIIIFAIFLFLKSYIPDVLYISYFYFLWGISIIMLPCIIFLCFHPKLIIRFFTISIYTFYVGLLSELVSLQIGFWKFPGTHFIGWITIAGLSFPIEEFVFFLMFIPPAFLTYYEFFDDDGE